MNAIIYLVGISLGIAFAMVCISLGYAAIYAILGFYLMYCLFEVLNETANS